MEGRSGGAATLQTSTGFDVRTMRSDPAESSILLPNRHRKDIRDLLAEDSVAHSSQNSSRASRTFTSSSSPCESHQDGSLPTTLPSEPTVRELDPNNSTVEFVKAAEPGFSIDNSHQQRVSLPFTQLSPTSFFPLHPSYPAASSPPCPSPPTATPPISSKVSLPPSSLGSFSLLSASQSPVIRRQGSSTVNSSTCHRFIDRRGRLPPSKRWRLYCFRCAFVIEPNIPYSGIRYNADKILPLINMESTSDSNQPPQKHVVAEKSETGSLSHSPTIELTSTNLPQLIIYRDSDVIAEVSNGTHQLYRTFGQLQQLFLIDCLVGQVNIADARFLVVVAESDGVAGICSTSFSAPPTQATVTPNSMPQGDLDAFVYRIQRVWLIPYHLSLERLNLRVSSAINVPYGGAIGLYYNDAALKNKRNSGRHSKQNSRRATTRNQKNSGTGASRLKSFNSEEPCSTGSERGKTLVERQARVTSDPNVDRLSSQGKSANVQETDGNPLPTVGHVKEKILKEVASSSSTVPRKKGSKLSTFPISVVDWDFVGFGDAYFNSLLGEKLAGYKQGIEKLLISSFYYSYDFEITNTLQRKRHLGFGFAAQGWPCGLVIPKNNSRDGNENKSGCPNLNSSTEQHAVDLLDGFSLSRTDGLATNILSHTTDGASSSPLSSSVKTHEVDSICYMNIADERFVWNKELYQPFRIWDIDPRWFTPVMRGSVTSATLTCGIHGLDLILFCRRSCRRAGTRYNHRGLDDAGNVANFNESEQLVSACRVDPSTATVINRSSGVAGGGWASFVQIRGSVPLFWEQMGALVLNPAPQLTRELDFAWKAFALHQRELSDLYGDVTYVNLLSAGRGGESKLSKALDQMLNTWTLLQATTTSSKPSRTESTQTTPSGTEPLSDVVAVKKSEMSDFTKRKSSAQEQPMSTLPFFATETISDQGLHHTVRHVVWDFHQQIKISGFEPALTEFVRSLGPDLQKYGYYCDRPHFAAGNHNHQYQTGVIRTNCLDCLDRTNAFQWFLCWSWLVHYLQQRGLKSFLTPGVRASERISARPFSLEANSPLGASNHHTTRSDIHHSFRIAEPSKNRHHRRGVVVGHTAAPSENASNVHIRGSRNRLGKGRGTTLTTLMNQHSSEEKAVGSFPPIKASSVRLLVVRSFGGDDGSVVSIYHCGTIAGTPKPIVAVGGSATTASGLSVLPKLGSDYKSENTIPFNSYPESMDGEFCPNILKDTVAKMWADHGDHISRAYTGTGSVLSGLLRQGKSSLATNMGHMMTSLGRFYQNTFEDAARQDAIELLLNLHERLSLPHMVPPTEDTSSVFGLSTARIVSPLGLQQVTHRVEPVYQDILSSLPTVTPPDVQRTRSYDVDRPITSLPPSTLAISDSMGYDSEQLIPKQFTGSLRIWYGTWNLGGHRVNEPLEHWLIPEDSELPSADLYVIAIQELVELTGMRILLSQNDRDKEWQLELNVKHALGPSFQMLRSHSLIGLYLAVFARTTVKDLISQVHISEVKLGFKGQMGNKGAVLVRLKLGGTSFCFVNVHLTPGLDKSQQRRSQLQTVLETRFQGRGNYSVRSHDCILVGGDFNFRCDADPQQAEMWLENGEWKELLHRDQFDICKRLAVSPFRELQEAPINFLPTYKFRRGTNLFDKGRSPAWCDRIFYSGEYTKCSVTRNFIRCISYNRLSEFLSSDHKPVYAIFQVAIQLGPHHFPVHSPSADMAPIASQMEKNYFVPSLQQAWINQTSGSWLIADDANSFHLEERTPRQPPARSRKGGFLHENDVSNDDDYEGEQGECEDNDNNSRSSPSTDGITVPSVDTSPVCSSPLILFDEVITENLAPSKDRK